MDAVQQPTGGAELAATVQENPEGTLLAIYLL